MLLTSAGPDAGVVELHHNGLRGGEGRELDMRQQLGTVVSALQRGLVEADDDRREADDERGDGDEGFRLSVQGAAVGHVPVTW